MSAVPLVVLESPGFPAVAVPSPAGGRLLDLCDAAGAAIPFSCRSATCGTCRVEVLEGADLLESPNLEEADLLQLYGDDAARRRLACQARVRPGPGRLHVRAVDDD
jgi:2Fe-2S ferredoxin